MHLKLPGVFVHVAVHPGELGAHLHAPALHSSASRIHGINNVINVMKFYDVICKQCKHQMRNWN